MNPKQLEGAQREVALKGYLVLAGLFVASLVACNLIFRKFFAWEFMGYEFQQSVGLLPYPLTFLVTDLISEIYGKRRANHVVVAGLVASVATRVAELRQQSLEQVAQDSTANARRLFRLP